MDKATPPDKILLRNIGECSQITNLDRGVYVLISSIKKRLRIKQNLYTILQVLSSTVYDKNSISSACYRMNKQELKNYTSHPIENIQLNVVTLVIENERMLLLHRSLVIKRQKNSR